MVTQIYPLVKFFLEWNLYLSRQYRQLFEATQQTLIWFRASLLYKIYRIVMELKKFELDTSIIVHKVYFGFIPFILGYYLP